MNRSSPLVSTDWLVDHLDAPDVRIADASWYLPQAGRDAKTEYRAAHIPGAVFLDIDTVKDRNSSLPHMMPAPEVFSSAMREMGIGDGSTIVVYDGLGLFSAACLVAARAAPSRAERAQRGPRQSDQGLREGWAGQGGSMLGRHRSRPFARIPGRRRSSLRGGDHIHFGKTMSPDVRPHVFAPVEWRHHTTG